MLTGHRGLAEAVLFTDLDKLQEGDKFYLHIMDEVLAYQVDQVKVVLPEETDDLTIVQGQDYCTLVTCTPYAINTHRMLVRGTRVPYNGEEETGDTPQVVQYQAPAHRHGGQAHRGCLAVDLGDRQRDYWRRSTAAAFAAASLQKTEEDD